MISALVGVHCSSFQHAWRRAQNATNMDNEVMIRTTRVVSDLQHLAKALSDADFPLSSIRLQGYASTVRQIEDEFTAAQARLIATRRAVLRGQP